MAIPLIGAAAMAAGRVVAKKLATRAVAGITGSGARNVAPINREMGTGSVKVIRRDVKQYPDDLDKLRMMTRPKASAPVDSLSHLSRSRKAIKINSNTRAR